MRIGIIGPIGAGKSLLASKLAAHFKAKLIEEPVAKSPFLPVFYNHKETMSFIAQNTFYSELFILLYKERNNDSLISDSTMFSNLVFAEQLHSEGFIDDHQLELVYRIAEEGLKILPPLDVHIVIMRRSEQLVSNVAKRGRAVEKGQEDYLAKHNANYYPTLKSIFDRYHISDHHILWLPVENMEDPAEFSKIIRAIEAKA
ncbi:MAG: deoxynucleoside kinase [Bacilli bacterium]|jgi:deoxyadenosine/deoxycytidine kinase